MTFSALLRSPFLDGRAPGLATDAMTVDPEGLAQLTVGVPAPSTWGRYRWLHSTLAENHASGGRRHVRLGRVRGEGREAANYFAAGV
jgi:hypothetical protein